MNLSDQGLQGSVTGILPGVYGLTGVAGGPFSQWAYPAHVFASKLARIFWLAVAWCVQRPGWLVHTPGGVGGDGQPGWSWAPQQAGEMAHALQRVDVRMAVGNWRLLQLSAEPCIRDAAQTPRWVLVSRIDSPEVWQHMLCALHMTDHVVGLRVTTVTPA